MILFLLYKANNINSSSTYKNYQIEITDNRIDIIDKNFDSLINNISTSTNKIPTTNTKKTKTHSKITESLAITETNSLLTNFGIYFHHMFLITVFDKTFILTFIFSILYNSAIVFLASITSLSIIAFAFTHLNFNLQKFIFIDAIIIVIYFFFGIKLLIEGVKSSNIETGITKSLKALNERIKRHAIDEDKIYDEESRILCKGNDTTLLIELENEVNEEQNSTYNNSLSFAKIFTLIFITEMGYKTQISSVKISAILPINSSSNTLLFAIIFVHLLNTIISISIGVLIKKFIPRWKHEVTIINGSMLMALAVNMLYLTLFHDFFLERFQKAFLFS